MVVALQPHLWSVEEYHQMIALGILAPENRVELLNGQIIDMPPQDPIHSTGICLLEELLRPPLQHQTAIRVQMPVTLSRSVPNPDLAIARGTIRDYSTRHPSGEDILLLVEVSNTTLNIDLQTKASIYAEAGIPEYWVLSVRDRLLHVFRQPVEGSYTEQFQVSERDLVIPVNFPDLSFEVAQMLP
jgi:Uma2 family endonuclease